MRQAPEIGFNILMVGRWNPAIFTPKWIRGNLVSNDEEVILAMSFGNPAAPPRISFSGIHLFITSDIIEIRPETLIDASINTCIRISSRILELLCHTPITALGINIRFEDDLPSAVFDDLFAFADQGRIDPATYQSTSSTIARSFALGASDSLNFSITQQIPKYLVEFNFHTESEDIKVVQTKTTEAYVAGRIGQAREFILNTYGATIDN
ncbi:MAG: hypothetical protein IPJ48_13150 [Propionivibrio sp.]|uniref:Uncharacterized protein n=1 Tax=Candidatus Propionivibrio dominans TaxID=2954373 RepID=A0A9D7FFS1_9RHOO|nr:hypothetical protein [Candidatus Propionivibrio dominans]